MSGMRVLFMGTSPFAVPTLKALLGPKHQVIGVVTQPDRPSGRGREMTLSPVKKVALEAGLPVYQPDKAAAPEFIETVRRLAPDMTVVAAFGQILPQELLDIPKYGSVNVHASLLPKYRGAAPVHHALFNGETRTGVTTMIMEAGLDTGPVLLQREVDILPEDNGGTLEARLADVGAYLLIETLDGLEKGTVHPKPQDHSQATKAPSVKREQCEIEWNRPAAEIVNRVRGCTPRPGAYTWWKGWPLKVWQCRLGDAASTGVPGEVIALEQDGVLVSAAEGSVVLTEVQPENRKRMTAAEFARGQRVTRGMSLSAKSG